MHGPVRVCLAAVVVLWLCRPATAQQPPAPQPAQPVAPAVTPPPAPPANAVAATVNGQPVPETAVQRGLKRVDPSRHAEARPAIVNYLVDNLLIDQYLLQLNLTIDPKEVEARLARIKDDIKKVSETRPDTTYEKVLQDLMMTEAELKAQIAADVRWDRWASQQANDKALQDFFNANREIFDGSQVRARHILLTVHPGDTKTADQAKAQLTAVKQQIEQQVQAGLTKLPPNADNLAREQARTRLLDDAFAAVAREKSDCPSKQQGGDVDWFYRSGGMVEPFAKAAFALKPYQMSDVVQTQFGCHLILVTDRRPGKDTKFEDVKDEVKEVFCDQLRENLCGQLRPKATIVINASK
jgi:peptidyl-prolyl cis-trans isomerase C